MWLETAKDKKIIPAIALPILLYKELAALFARHRPTRKWLEITWRKVKFLRWEISWIDKAYVFGKRFHHLDLGIILICIGWILVIHDWFVHERSKVTGTIVEEVSALEIPTSIEYDSSRSRSR